MVADKKTPSEEEIKEATQTLLAGQVLGKTLDNVLLFLNRAHQVYLEKKKEKKESADKETNAEKEGVVSEEAYHNFIQALSDIKQSLEEKSCLELTYAQAEVYGAVLGAVLENISEQIKSFQAMTEENYVFVKDMMVWSLKKITGLVLQIRSFVGDSNNKNKSQVFWVEGDSDLFVLLSQRKVSQEKESPPKS